MSTVEEGMAAFKQLMDETSAKVDAANSADLKDVKALAHLLRNTADTLEHGEISLAHFKTIWAFEFSRQMEVKAALKLEPDSKSKKAKLKKAKHVMDAIESGHLSTVMEISRHYAQHPYVDTFKDE